MQKVKRRKSENVSFPLFHLFTFEPKLFEPNLQSSFASVTDRFGFKVLFGLQRQVNNAALGRVELSESERPSIFADIVGGKMRHRMQLGLARLPETLGIDNKPMLAVQFTSENLEQQNLECIEHLTIFGQRKMSITTAQIKQTTLVCPSGRDSQVKSHPAYDIGKKFFCVFAGFVHNNGVKK